MVPTEVMGAGLGGGRIGRCRGLPAEHALAFAMGTHGRLGAASPVRCLAGEEGLLRMIAGWCRRWRWVGGAAGREEGVVRLLGGGQMLESVRSLSSLPFDMEGPQGGSEEEGSEGWESEDGDEGSEGWGSEDGDGGSEGVWRGEGDSDA